MLTESATQALSILRDASLFQWYVIPLFALVVYVYSVEIEPGQWQQDYRPLLSLNAEDGLDAASARGQ